MIDLIANGARIAETLAVSAESATFRKQSAAGKGSVMPFSANPQNPQRGEPSISPQAEENPQLSANNPQPVNRSVMPFPANPQNPQKETSKSSNERNNPHLNPEWVAARDEWHRHYFICKRCQSYHRSQKYKPPQNPCDTGKLLYELYLLAGKR